MPSGLQRTSDSHRYRRPAVPSSPGCTLRKTLQPLLTLYAQKGAGQIFWGSRKCTSQGGAALYFLPVQPRLALRMWQVPASDSDCNHSGPAYPSRPHRTPQTGSNGFQEPPGKAGLGQQSPYHTSGRFLRLSLLSSTQARQCQHLISCPLGHFFTLALG